jgi:hypothetical protein
MEEKPSPLSDLSFLKFPELTQEVVADIGWLFALLALTVLLTVVVHRWMQTRHLLREHRRSFERLSHAERQPPFVREMLRRLVALSPYRDGFALIRDARAFEAAVQRLFDADPEADLEAVARVRRLFHMNVMNPLLRLESTRQLLPDLPLRLISKVGEETLDLYCTLLDVNEAFMLVNVPEEPEIQEILRANPHVQLIFWREQDGETVFDTALEFVPSEAMSLVRAKHAFRSEEASQRVDFRLTVNFPLTWRYVERKKLGGIKASEGRALEVRHGEGHLLDLSYGGAAFVTHEPLASAGLAQLQFAIHQKPVHMILEVVSQSPTQGGAWVHRGPFRGMSQEIKTRIFNYLSREQVVRLRDREVFRKRPRDSA